MDFLFCLSNASLTQRVLAYLSKKLKREIDCVTVIFLNEFWVLRVRLKATTSIVLAKDCQAVLNENGIPCPTSVYLRQVASALDSGHDPRSVMNDYHVTIISHGSPQGVEIEHFRERFVSGLGYCPPSLI
ncbi:hypothetical protein [Synechococcus sp. PCC 7335]|uniref:hypothetical protein n=1 Tax=Synechococcus sp. (strain ATCC 29403 / PCC 7335) TaxID=91464 RepID=UPI0003035892|nr:hypothetical protein [Synechococcus sp. PCC 7335]